MKLSGLSSYLAAIQRLASPACAWYNFFKATTLGAPLRNTAELKEEKR
ncbi:MAG: hypothetical protein KBD66_01365 [Candidatus Doudnabacteria bacterium]|nr:hypothetical protein [Candidatus Doudnabacteria bacterium]